MCLVRIILTWRGHHCIARGGVMVSATQGTLCVVTRHAIAFKTHFGATHAIFPQNVKLIPMWTFAPHRVIVRLHGLPKFALSFAQSNFCLVKSILCLQQLLMEAIHDGPHLGFGWPNPFALNFDHVSIKKKARSARAYATKPQPPRGPYGVVAVGVRLIR